MSTPTTRFFWLAETPEGFDAEAFETALQDFVDENEAGYAWTDEYTGETVVPSVIVVTKAGHRARGMYRGGGQILGGTEAYPDRLRDLADAAWEHAHKVLTASE